MIGYIVAICLLVLVIAIVVVLWRKDNNRYECRVESISSELNAVRAEREAVAKGLMDERVERARVEAERDQLSAAIEQTRREQEAARREREEAERSMKAEFKSLANELLLQHTHDLRQTNRDSLDVLLKPFKDNITDFRERVERIYAAENEQRGALKNELDNLLKLNMQMTTSAANLTDALRGNSKVQGDWGEVYLETILESTGWSRACTTMFSRTSKMIRVLMCAPMWCCRCPRSVR